MSLPDCRQTKKLGLNIKRGKKLDNLRSDTVPKEQFFIHYANLVRNWHHARNLVEGSTDQAQYVKLMEEAGELAKSISKGKDIKDDIGDMLVVLINIAERNGVSLTECLETAWEEIKDRKGKMIDGVFVKEDDL